MERFAGNNADTKRYRIVLREAMERLRHLRVVIDDGSVRCFIEKGFNFDFESIDVLFGPL